MNRRNVLIGGLAAAVLVSLPLLAQVAMPGMHTWGAARLERLATYLNLSDDQKTQIKPIVENAHQQALPLIQQLRQNQQAIAGLVKTGLSDQQLQKLASSQGALVSQLEVMYAKTMAQVRALLTPEQRDKADQLMELLRPPFRHR